MAKYPTDPIGTLQVPLGGHAKSAGETLDFLLGVHSPSSSRDDLAGTQSTPVKPLSQGDHGKIGG